MRLYLIDSASLVHLMEIMTYSEVLTDEAERKAVGILTKDGELYKTIAMATWETDKTRNWPAPICTLWPWPVKFYQKGNWHKEDHLQWWNSA